MKTEKIENFTKQNIFDFVAEKLFQQGKPAIDNRGRCMYRTSDGLKCAIGWLISDDVYSPGMEGRSCHMVISCFPHSKYLKQHLSLIRRLQHAHDLYFIQFGINEWKREMREIAKFHGLQIPSFLV